MLKKHFSHKNSAFFVIVATAFLEQEKCGVGGSHQERSCSIVPQGRKLWRLALCFSVCDLYILFLLSILFLPLIRFRYCLCVMYVKYSYKYNLKQKQIRFNEIFTSSILRLYNQQHNTCLLEFGYPHGHTRLYIIERDRHTNTQREIEGYITWRFVPVNFYIKPS